MGNLKQRLIKAGRDYNYAEGVKVKAAEAIKADQIVYISGSDGPYLQATRADNDTKAATTGRLMVAKHDIPSGGYGVVLPWKVVYTKNTAAASVGDLVYLGGTPGTAVADNIVLTAEVSGAGRQVVLGHVTVADTIANGGAILIDPDGALKLDAGVADAAQVLPSSTLCFLVKMTTVGAQNVDIVLKYPVIVTGGGMTNDGGTTAATLTVTNGTGSNHIFVCAATSGANDYGAQTSYFANLATVAAGGTLRVSKDAGNNNDRAIIYAIPA
tara:strand:- start:2633 stop:3442 length:810 start_codon:yes stop_codon:yes gene_type:complete